MKLALLSSVLALLTIASTTIAGNSKCRPQPDPLKKCIAENFGYESWNDGCNTCFCAQSGIEVCTMMYCDAYKDPRFECQSENPNESWTYNNMTCKCNVRGDVVCV
ncbi:hypothetical protein EV182_006665 [Spiromyces aspiralis]|uniref:Uncharacterized protein n=1 Tax=Spiromyces aspiralis TaxID=68401 RepID=A0ACC1HBH0_9FUNG|nr:hypothetical protein EV182_006665 [Spiromyces aspiralis]